MPFSLSGTTKKNVKSYIDYLNVLEKCKKEKKDFLKDEYEQVLFSLDSLHTQRHLAKHYTQFSRKEIESLLEMKDSEINDDIARYQRNLTLEQVEKFGLNKSLVYFFKSHDKEKKYKITQQDYLSNIKPFVDWGYLVDTHLDLMSPEFLRNKHKKYQDKVLLDSAEKLEKQKPEEGKKERPALNKRLTLKEREKLRLMNDRHNKVLSKYLALCVSSTFTLAGSAVTQTGTDTDLSELSGISGVTITNEGGHTIYDLGANRLVVNGSLSFAITAKEQLKITADNANNNVKLDVDGGSLVVGDINKAEFEHKYSDKIPAIITLGNISDRPTGYGGRGVSGRRPGLSAQNAGTIAIYGQLIHIYTSIGIPNDCALHLRNVFLYTENLYDYSATSTYQSVRSNVGAPVLANHAIVSGWFTEDNPSYFGISGSTPQITLDIRDIPDGNYRYAGGLGSDNNNPIYNVINAHWGADYESETSSTNAAKRFRILFTKEVEVILSDVSGNAIEGGKVYFDGGAIETTQTTPLGNSISVTPITPNTFLFTTQLDGSTGTQTINLGENQLPSGTTNGTYSRTSTNNNFAASFASYNHLYASTQVALQGNGVLVIKWILTNDASITQTDKTTVDAYTEINTAQQFYDRTKSFLADNYAGETAAIVTRVGDTIDAGSYDVVIDATATNVFDFDGTTITIKSSDFTSNIITTGTVSAINGAVISGVYEDVNGVVIKIASDENFTIKGTGITYTQNTNNPRTQVAIGTTVEYACWQLGKEMLYVSQVINEPTTINLNFVREQFVDTSLDVSAQIADIDSSRVDGILTYEFGEMELTLDQAKAVTHRIFENEEALDFVLSNDVTGGVSIKENNIAIDAPIIHLERKDSLDITQEVSIRAYIDISGAVALNQSYTLTPPDVEGLRVIYYKDPIAIDYNAIKNAAANALTEYPIAIDYNAIKNAAANALTEYNASTSEEVAEARDEATIAANNTQT